MKKLSAFLALAFFAGTISAIAQTPHKLVPKPVAKKECKKGDFCCAGKSKIDEAAPKTPVKN